MEFFENSIEILFENFIKTSLDRPLLTAKMTGNAE